MIDPRVTKQADILVNYSTKVKRGDNVLVLSDFIGRPLVTEVYRLLVKKGAAEIKLHFDSYELSEIYFQNSTPSQRKIFPQIAMDEIKKIDCWIGIRCSANTRGLTGVDSSAISERSTVLRPITDQRVENTRWVLTQFPTESQAQEADMSLADYEDFVFKSINGVDWKNKHKEQEKLTKLLTETSEVHIIGPGTDLTLGKKGRKAINAGGEHNMPDGEVFTSVAESEANGAITYSYPALYFGREFHEVRLEFKKGKVVKATAQKGEKDLNKILDMDKGARYIGELGIGNNFQIDRFTKDILFDEKIGGSIHIALGKGYKETGSKNKSGLHWDMIKDLRKGGELWFDDKLVQKNGKWKISL